MKNVEYKVNFMLLISYKLLAVNQCFRLNAIDKMKKDFIYESWKRNINISSFQSYVFGVILEI